MLWKYETREQVDTQQMNARGRNTNILLSSKVWVCYPVSESQIMETKTMKKKCIIVLLYYHCIILELV